MMEEDTCMYDDSVDESLIERETVTVRIDEYSEYNGEHDARTTSGAVGSRSRYGNRRTKRSSSVPSSCWQSQPCTLCLYLVLVFLLLSSAVSVVVLAVLITAPYHKANGFLRAWCSPLHTIRDYVDSRCSCGEGCVSQIPCIRITVRVTPPPAPPASSGDVSVGSQHGNNSSWWIAQLSENEAKLGRQCSFYPVCNNSSAENQAAIETYVRKFGLRQHNYTCLYNPAHVTQVIRTRLFTLSNVIHAVLWPVGVLVTSIVTLKLTMRRRGCKFL